MGGPDIVLTPQTALVIGTLLSSLVAAIGVLSAAVAMLYRQVLRERDRVLSEKDARMVDHWRDLETAETRIKVLESANERLQRLANDATEGWKMAVAEGKSRRP